MGAEPNIGGFYRQNGCFIMEHPIKMDDLGIPLFLETPILTYIEFPLIHVAIFPAKSSIWMMHLECAETAAHCDCSDGGGFMYGIRISDMAIFPTSPQRVREKKPPEMMNCASLREPKQVMTDFRHQFVGATLTCHQHPGQNPFGNICWAVFDANVLQILLLAVLSVGLRPFGVPTDENISPSNVRLHHLEVIETHGPCQAIHGGSSHDLDTGVNNHGYMVIVFVP